GLLQPAPDLLSGPIRDVRLRPHVRFGSLADIKERQSHVRFTPESRHSSAPVACPLSANSGHWPLFDRIGLFTAPPRRRAWPKCRRLLPDGRVEPRVEGERLGGRR